MKALVALAALCAGLAGCYVAPVISATDLGDAAMGPGEDYVCEVYVRDGSIMAKGTVTSHNAHWLVLETEGGEVWIPREQILKVRVLDKPAERPDGDKDEDD